MQQKKLHNNNSKESIICYGCNWKNYIKKNYSIFKFKESYPKTKNIISCQEFNNIKSNNARIFNIICIIFFLKKNIDNPWEKETNDEEFEDKQISKKHSPPIEFKN